MSSCQGNHPDMTIRTYDDSDHRQVIDLWRNVFGYASPHNEPAFTIQRKTKVQPELFFVATIEQRVVGTVMGGYDGHRGWIYSLAIAPEFRRRGVGAALVRHVEQAMSELGCPKINLQILASNADVVAFYRKLGYQVEERINMGKVL